MEATLRETNWITECDGGHAVGLTGECLAANKVEGLGCGRVTPMTDHDGAYGLTLYLAV